MDSFRWPQDNSGKRGASAELAPPPPGGPAREAGRRKEACAGLMLRGSLSGWDSHGPGRHTCFFLEPCPAEWPVSVLLRQEQLPARTRGIGLRMAFCRRG